MKRSFKILMSLLAIFVAALSFAAPEFVGNASESSTAASTMAMAAVAKNELRERELIKHFRHENTWLSKIPSKNQWVNNDVIRLNEVGIDPEVLIDNTSYPISVTNREDTSIVISLFKYDTTNTVVTEDEIYALPYEKKSDVQRQHRETLEEKTREHALHTLAPGGNSTETPILETTGPDNGNGLKRLVYADLIALKTKLDKLKVPASGRVLVLSSEHMSDLILEDKALQNQFHKHEDGMISAKFAGFELYSDVYSPKYDATLNKIPFGAATQGREASVLFHTKTTAKARGTVEAFISKASEDPINRQTVIGFRLWHLAIPTRKLGQGAIVSANVA